MSSRLACLFAIAAPVALCACSSHAVVLGTATITDADHYGYYGFGSTSQFNTKRTIGPFTGTARVIRIQGTVTALSSEAWLSSIQVQPSGSGLAVYQPSWQFSSQRDFTGTVGVSATIYAPGGFDASKPINLEMFSLDSEEFVPGLDARSTLTYTVESDFAPGSVEYSGELTSRDPAFNRPIQYGYTDGFGNPQLWPPELTGAFPHHDVQTFHVSTPGKYTLVTANEFESSAVLYAGGFNRNDPLANFVAGVNQGENVLRSRALGDLPYLDDAVGASVIEATLTPGVQYYFVTTAFNAPGIEADGGPFIGRYKNLITGPGNVTLGLVPEPGTLATLTLAVPLLRRRR